MNFMLVNFKIFYQLCFNFKILVKEYTELYWYFQMSHKSVNIPNHLVWLLTLNRCSFLMWLWFYLRFCKFRICCYILYCSCSLWAVNMHWLCIYKWCVVIDWTTTLEVDWSLWNWSTVFLTTNLLTLEWDCDLQLVMYHIVIARVDYIAMMKKTKSKE